MEQASAGVLTIYITAQSVVSALATEEGRGEVLSRLSSSGFGRVILESYRGGLVVDEDVLRDARDFFRSYGFATLGGFMPVWGEGFGKCGEGVELRAPFFCYSDEATVGGLDGEVRKLARLFDQVVIDDAFLTACRCGSCDVARAGRDWGVFRRSLLADVARGWAAAAHAENPEVRLTVKFPQYYDHYHRFGYDAASFPIIFDAVWAGTETRDPATLDYGYVEPYESYVNAQWMRACAGKRFEGAWFDFIDCDARLFYEQGITTFLGAPDEITIFCYGDGVFDGGKMADLAAGLPGLERLRAGAREPRGVYVVKPPNSDACCDMFIFDYLGMLSIPCVFATELNAAMQSVIVTAHAMADPDTPRYIGEILASGGQVIVTFDALARMADTPELLEWFGFTAAGISPHGAAAARFGIGEDMHEAPSLVQLAGDLAPADAEVLVWAQVQGCERGGIQVPFITAKAHSGGGRAVVWNVGTFSEDAFVLNEALNVPVRTTLFNLPQAVLDLLRATATEPLGLRIHAPARVACFLFARQFVAVNYTDAPAHLRIAGLVLERDSLFADAPDTCWEEDALVVSGHGYAQVELGQ